MFLMLQLLAKDIYLMIRSCAFLVFVQLVRFLELAGFDLDDIREFTNQKSDDFLEECWQSEKQWNKMVEIVEENQRKVIRRDSD